MALLIALGKSCLETVDGVRGIRYTDPPSGSCLSQIIRFAIWGCLRLAFSSIKLAQRAGKEAPNCPDTLGQLLVSHPDWATGEQEHAINAMVQ